MSIADGVPCKCPNCKSRTSPAIKFCKSCREANCTEETANCE